MKIKLPFMLICLALLAGCKDDDSNTGTPTGLIYSYAPSNIGHELVYDVSLITKDEFTGAKDTSIYQMKEVIESTFIDAQGRPTQRLERYTRPTVNDPWVIDQVWTSNLTSNHYERKDDNTIYVKLVFPVGNNVTWNGNVYNTLDPMIYEYRDLHLPMTLGSLSFDSTLTVLQVDEDNFIETIFSKEQFATNVGLIYRENNYIKKDYTIPNQPGIKAQSLYKQTLISFVN
jgi:hypothetical protein